MIWRDVLSIRAEADPFVTMRVSSLIAVDNTIPASLTVADLRTGEMEIVVELRGLPEHKAGYLAKKIASSIPTVLSV